MQKAPSDSAPAKTRGSGLLMRPSGLLMKPIYKPKLTPIEPKGALLVQDLCDLRNELKAYP